jgi:hypothetical protein
MNLGEVGRSPQSEPKSGSRSFGSIARVPEVAGAFLSTKLWHERANCSIEPRNSSRGHFPQQSFEFAVWQLDRVEVGRVLRQHQKPEMKHMAVSGPPLNVARMHSWKRRSRICAAICNGSTCRRKAAATPVLAPGSVAATPVGSEARVAATAVPGAGPFPSSVAAERMPAMQLSPVLWSVRMQ